MRSYDKQHHNLQETQENQQQINIDGKQILKNREGLSRWEINVENSSFVTLKDHKESFSNNPTVRFINPAKSELGRISKDILDTSNKNIRKAMGLNQWRNTDTVIDWFKDIRNNTSASSSYLTLKNFILPSPKTCLKKP